jgi:hypothetical protein
MGSLNIPSRTSILTFIFGTLVLWVSGTILPVILNVEPHHGTHTLLIIGTVIIALVNLLLVPEMTRRQNMEKVS